MSILVITLAKNDLEGLKRTERSIDSQSTKVIWTIITPNDNSPTHQYAQNIFTTGKAESIIFDEGLGIYHSMNLGIFGVEKQEWIWFLNSGDEFAFNDTYEMALETLTSCGKRWIFGGHFLGSSSGDIFGEVSSPFTFRPERQLFAKNYISHQSTIFEAKFLQELGGFDEDYKMAADWDLMVRASKVDPGYRVSIPLSVFYMGGLSTRSRSVGNKELFILRKKHLSSKFAMRSYLWFLYRSVRNLCVQSLENKFPTFADKVRKLRLNVRHRLASTTIINSEIGKS